MNFAESFDRLVFVAGPTASGKSALAVYLAERFDGEVVSADSMQVYQGMRIGTAAPTEAEKRGIPHHMLGVIPPTEPFSVELYRNQTLPILRDILARGKTAVVAGGTGLYFDSLLLNGPYAPIEPDHAYRFELYALAEKEGNGAVYRLLAAADPEAADRLHPNNLKRVIRALEVLRLTGMSIAEHDRRSRMGSPAFRPIQIGLNIEPRERLYARIDARVDKMLAQGLLDETAALLAAGVPEDATAMQAIGYKELVPVLRGAVCVEEAAAQIKRRSRNYAKRQLTWFRRDERIQWFTYTDEQAFDQTAADAARYIQEKI